MKTKYGIYASDAEYYGFDAEWEEYAWCEGFHTEEVNKSQIIKCLDEYIDVFVKFIRASEIRDFIKALEDTSVGDELYERLCNNIQYIKDLERKAISVSQSIYDKFCEITFGKVHPYSTEDDCHLVPFPECDGKISDLLKCEDTFKVWFDSRLARADKSLFGILIENASVYEIIVKDAKSKIEGELKTFKYHKDSLLACKKRIKDELEKLAEIELDEETANWMEEVKRSIK